MTIWEIIDKTEELTLKTEFTTRELQQLEREFWNYKQKMRMAEGLLEQELRELNTKLDQGG